MDFKGVKAPKNFIKEKLKGEKLNWGHQNKFGIDFNYALDEFNRVAAIFTWEIIDNTFDVSVIPEENRVPAADTIIIK